MSEGAGKSVADLTLERVGRLATALADMMEAHAAMGRNLDRRLSALEARMAGLETEVRGLAAEQALLGNRVEAAISRALRVNLRLDELEDQARDGGAASP